MGDADDKLMFLGNLVHLQLNGAIVEEPGQLAIRVVHLVVVLEFVCDGLHFLWQHAQGFVHGGPGAPLENIHVQLDCIAGIGDRVSVLILDLLTTRHIIHHLDEFHGKLGAIFHLQFLDHDLLVLIRNGGPVEQTLSKFMLVLSQEHVSTRQATEEANNCRKLRVHVIIVFTLKPCAQLRIRIFGHEHGCLRLAIHEVAERVVSVLLEFHLVREAFTDHLIDLGLQGEQLAHKHDRIL